MYWLGLFAVIMEIVFRVRDHQAKLALNKSESLTSKKLSKQRVAFADYERNDFQSNWPISEYFDSDTSLSEGRYYRIKNEKDNLFLTLTAVQVENCLYRIINISGSQDCDWTNYTIVLDNQNRGYISQLWQIEPRAQMEFLMPANTAIVDLDSSNINSRKDPPKWTTLQRNSQRRTKSVVTTRSTTTLKSTYNIYDDIIDDSNDYKDVDQQLNQNDITISSTTMTENWNDDSDNFMVGSNYGNVESDLDSGPDSDVDPDFDASKDIRKRSVETSCWNGIQTIWKLKWRVIKTSSLNNLKHAHFEIRGPNRTCIIVNGFIGNCGQSDSTWTFYTVTSRNKISAAKYFPDF